MPLGSGSAAPRARNKLTHLGYNAIERIASDVRSDVLYARASAL